MDQRGWRQQKTGWWCCRGEWSSCKFEFSEEGANELRDHPEDHFELQPLDMLQYVTGIRILQEVSEGGPIIKLIEFLQNSTNPTPLLERLEIFRHKMHDTKSRYVLDVMLSSNLSRLRYLKLVANSCNNLDIDNLARMIESGGLPSLKHLTIRGGEIGKGHFALAKVMESSRMFTLEKLDHIRTGMENIYCEVYETDLSSGKLRCLKEISFNSNNIGIRGAQALGRAIQSGELKNLAVLNISDNLITDDGMIALAKSFEVGVGSVLPNLKYLHFVKNPFTEVGQLALADALKSGHLNSLEILDLNYSTNPSEKGANALVSALCSDKYLTVNIAFEWYKFPHLDLRKDQLVRRNFRKVDISAGLGNSPVVLTAFCKVYLCGSPNVGKTTLRRSLQRSFWESLWN